MATISILPGEHFEHIHATASSSTILNGVARVTMHAESRTVRAGECIAVPANCSHEFENIGDVPLVIECGYGPRKNML